MTDEQKLALATQFTTGDHLRRQTITIEMTDTGYGPNTGDGIKRWAIREGSCCLNHKGKWDWEMSPSNRTKAWLAKHRWTDLDKALTDAQLALSERYGES